MRKTSVAQSKRATYSSHYFQRSCRERLLCFLWLTVSNRRGCKNAVFTSSFCLVHGLVGLFDDALYVAHV